jgi:hypothetical protein
MNYVQNTNKIIPKQMCRDAYGTTRRDVYDLQDESTDCIGFSLGQKPEQEPEPKREPEQDPEREPGSKSKSTPESEPEPEHQPELEPESKSEPEREPKRESEPEPEHQLELEQESVTVSEPERESKQELESIQEPEYNTVGTEIEIAGLTGPDISTTGVSENDPEVGPCEFCFQMTAQPFQSNLEICPEYTVTIMLRCATTIHQITFISATVENSSVNGIDLFNTIILCDDIIAGKHISDASIDLIIHEQTFSGTILRAALEQKQHNKMATFLLSDLYGHISFDGGNASCYESKICDAIGTLCYG